MAANKQAQTMDNTSNFSIGFAQTSESRCEPTKDDVNLTRVVAAVIMLCTFLLRSPAPMSVRWFCRTSLTGRSRIVGAGSR